jgi:hypothetical protein
LSDKWFSIVIDVGKAPGSVCAAQNVRTVYELIDAAYKRLPSQPLVVDGCQAHLSKSISSKYPKGTFIEQASFRIDGRGEVQSIVATGDIFVGRTKRRFSGRVIRSLECCIQMRGEFRGNAKV